MPRHLSLAACSLALIAGPALAADAPPTTQPAAAPVAASAAATLKPVAADGTYATPSTKEILAWQSLIQPVGAGGAYSLDQFGKVDTMQNAQAAYEAAQQHIVASGGGVLMIPIQTDWGWKPKTPVQRELRTPMPPASTKGWREGVGMSVVDLRGSKPTIYPAMINGLTIKRTLDLTPGDSLPHWGYYSLLDIQNTVAYGSTSYHDWVQEDAEAGPDAKIYVATIRGLFPGMFITANAWSTAPRLYIKSLGYDKQKQKWYVVADLDAPVKKGTILSNKNHTNIVKMETKSHNENQTFDLCLWRHNYSQGDNYLIDARFKYTGDIHSTAGDENGVIFAGFVEGHTTAFGGKVEKWDPATGELKFSNGKNNDTLGSGRPIININPKKSITGGNVWIVKPSQWTEDSSTDADNPTFKGKTYPTVVAPNSIGVRSLRVGGLIRLSADSPATADCVGRYFAVDQDDEYPKGTKVRRWYLIDNVTVNADGTKDIRIVRHWWGAKSAGSPTLYNPDNYSYDGHEKPLKYIIAPGANAYDVSDGLPGSNKSTLRLAPAPFNGSEVDFAAGDPVEQAIGPDPFHPQTMRTWTWDVVPSMFPSFYFDVGNNGDVQRFGGMRFRGGSGDLKKDIETRWTHTTTFDRFLEFQATSQNAVVFNGDVAGAAILFNQPHDRAQPITWMFGDANAKKKASMTVSPADGTLNYDGGGAAIPGGLSQVGGLSGGESKANNLRGIKVPVKAGDKQIVVKFPKAEADGEYAVFLELSWLTNRAVTEQTAEGFTVSFETAPPADAKLHWMIVR